MPYSRSPAHQPHFGVRCGIPLERSDTAYEVSRPSGRVASLVIIPTFNERENIGALVEEVLALAPEIDVLVVDDGSPDGTAAIVRKAQERHPGRLHLIVRQGKGGRGSAVLEGFRFALRGPYGRILEMDADFSHPSAEIPALLEMLNRCDWVVGSRYLRGESVIRGWGWRRRIFSALANIYARAVLRIPIHDYTNGFRSYRREAVESLAMEKITAKGYVVLSEVAWQLYRKGTDVGERATVFVNRRRGHSNLSLREISEAFLFVLRIRFSR